MSSDDENFTNGSQPELDGATAVTSALSCLHLAEKVFLRLVILLSGGLVSFISFI